MMKIYLSAILSAALLSSCVVNHGDFTILSNKLIDVKRFSLAESPRQRNVEGDDTTHIILFIQAGGEPKLSEALNDAFRVTDTDVMSNVTIKSWAWYIPYIYGSIGWSVTGDAIKTRKN